jgi:thymidylate synthase
MCFKIRDDKLHLSVFMRSSDVWLGLPYDIFAFSMVAYLMVVELRSAYPKLAPGCLWITAASSHLYARDYYLAKEIPAPQEVPRPAPEALWCSNARYFLGYLDVLRGSKPGDTHRWWSK